jgi:hypothetical protein
MLNHAHAAFLPCLARRIHCFALGVCGIELLWKKPQRQKPGTLLMPSRLNGLINQLAWNIFPRRRGTTPAAGQTGTAAQTDVSITVHGISFHPIRGSRPARFQLVDNITVTISFNARQSFVMDWVFQRPQNFQNDLLSHEQGHYNISALIARDFFIEVMQQKSQSFQNAHEGINAVNQIRAGSLAKIQDVNNLYDSDTSNGLNATGQAQWDGFIRSAFTQPRSTGDQSPDGIPYKTRLIDVLRAGGKQV